MEEVGRLPIANAVDAIAPIISRDNRYGIPVIARRLLTLPEVLHARTVTDRPDEVTIRARTRDKKSIQATLRGVLRSEMPALRDLHESLHVTKALHWQNAGVAFWRTRLLDGKAPYVQINAVANMPGVTLPAFCEETLAEIDRTPPERIIIDLRHNRGGSRELMLPCVDGLKSRGSASRRARLFVLVGAETFSAGLWSALDLDRLAGAVSIGQPTSGRPNFFGETRRADTPVRRIPFTYASRFNQRSDPSDTGEALVPEIQIPETFEDYLTGRDPVLDRALRHR